MNPVRETLEAADRAKKARITAWSYSRYAAYEQCPLAFKLKFIDKIEEEERAAFKKGDEAHKALATYVMGYGDAMPTVVKHPFQQKFVSEVRNFPHDDKIVEQQWGFNIEWQPTGWFGNDVWFRNILDLYLVYEDMTAEVVDWKTGKKYGSNEDQLELNAMSAFAKYKPVGKVTSRMVYLDLGTEDVRDFDRGIMPHLVAKWNKKVAPMFNDGVFLPRPNEKCRYCSYSRSNKKLCRFG